MKAMVIKSLGNNDVFQQVERENPQVKAGHLVIAVKATSVNPLDTMLRSTETPWSANLPEILHGDVAGVVMEVGDSVTKFKVGDEVYGCAGGIAGTDGALAEYMLVDADLMALKPSTLSMREAAALPLVSITAWEALVDKLKVQPGENVLIHGATGGVGHIAIQLAKHLGATVTATTLPRNLKTAATLGADNLVNVTEQDVHSYVSQYTGGNGFDAVFDTIAGENIQRSFEAARYNGSVATTLPINDVLQVALKSLSFHSVLMLIPLVHGLNRRSHGEILTQVAELVDKGAIKPLIDESRHPIWEVSAAHQRLESGQAVGKVVLTV
ncbi:zinc-dependent alcohol dehydrogenase family protein [Photobacterium sp. OFAV2-7]|uniref:zinc-dependent alcohol dehydrogenase family protein n=1 Tax=Photobacterium sp. OFAV2-7 TaxID=2917748 RepID=UPI001EF464AF|nr:zinc-dependent alcohol dehydrogenase family protein [Photobacterium sp. OFAV2-7]MCG7588273.1 zinc-dependent alcohol dehydrogenase family protein [Photobacterium sp. OFAV2-7]